MTRCPLLDGAPDPDRPNWVTVRLARPRALTGGVPGLAGIDPVAAHDADGYAAGAPRLDASAAPSLLAWRAGLGAFFSRPGATALDTVVVGRRLRPPRGAP